MTSLAIHPKTNCVVIGCRRTSKCFPHEWLCGEHWRLVDRPLKTFRTRYLKRLAGKQPSPQRWRNCESLIWRRMKRQAIERAAGL